MKFGVLAIAATLGLAACDPSETVTKYGGMECWHKGCTLTARSQVCLPEVAHRQHFSFIGNYLSIAQLKAVRRVSIWFMPNGLAVVGNSIYRTSVNAGLRNQTLNRFDILVC